MLNGITVLNKITEKGLPNWALPLFLIIIIIGIIIGIVWSVVESDIEYLKPSILFSLLIGSLFMLTVTTFFKVSTGEYTYQVTIGKSVNFEEFNNEYFVIKQEGEIYTIGER